MTPEQKARVSIDTLFIQAGWHVWGMVGAYKPRALFQMVTGCGKAFACFRFIYRLIKFTGDKRAQALRQSMTAEPFAG